MRLLDIIYQDESLLAVAKPPGILTIPDRFDSSKANLYTLLQQQFGEIYTVHRLDKETSGLILFARTPEAHAHLNRQFAERTTRKWYYALVQGKLSEEKGSIDKPLAPSTTRPGAMVVAKRGKEALTHYEVLEEFKEFSYVQAEIRTGRMHQIRVHFQSIGHPLAVDALYGKRQQIYLREIKLRNYKYSSGVEEEDRPIMERCTLHAARLQFVHPQSGAWMDLEAPLPKDFEALLKQLRKWSQVRPGGRLV